MILSLLVTLNVLPSQPISAVNVFCSSSFRRHHQSAPYISITITNNSYTAGLLFCWKYCATSSFSQTSHSLTMPIQYEILHSAVHVMCVISLSGRKAYTHRRDCESCSPHAPDLRVPKM